MLTNVINTPKEKHMFSSVKEVVKIPVTDMRPNEVQQKVLLPAKRLSPSTFDRMTLPAPVQKTNPPPMGFFRNVPSAFSKPPVA